MSAKESLRQLIANSMLDHPCSFGHDWKLDGGRWCPLDLDPICSQPVFRCKRCDQYDYGEPGGPGHDLCETDCHMRATT